ncbi:pyocin knob domain-containing protein, partial [Atlantibacter hermannii]|uniref:pyocin knob domain-containing protein n=1 Tax=Atlantibacter hermannii TaxID=565 RepID=UPI003B3A66FB
MSAGTLKLTNNSTAVVGTSTLFTTDLKPGDFIVTTIGGVLYTLPVDTVTSNTAVTLVSPFTGPTTTGAAWAAVPRKTMNQVTAELVAQSTEALRGLLVEKGVWTNFYTAPDDITVQLTSNMPAVTGPGWQKMAGLVGTAVQWRGNLPATANLNTYGPAAAGSWNKGVASGATIANGYPEEGAQGVLEVLPGGYFGLSQRYTVSRNGNVYTRSPSAAWNGTDGPWGAWAPAGSKPLNDLGLGLAAVPWTSGTTFDWQQADFIVGQVVNTQYQQWTNGPALIGPTPGATTRCYISTELAYGTSAAVKVTVYRGSTLAEMYSILITGAKGSRSFSVRQIYTNVELGALGIGMSAITTSATFDWQQFDPVSGAIFRVAVDNITNMPTGIAFASGTGVFIKIDGTSAAATRFSAEVIPDTAADANYRVFKILGVGAKGARVFSVRQIYTNTDVVPVANGGTGATTAAAARTALGVAYGNAAGTVAQGNDARLGTIDGKSGGAITSSFGKSNMLAGSFDSLYGANKNYGLYFEQMNVPGAGYLYPHISFKMYWAGNYGGAFTWSAWANANNPEYVLSWTYESGTTPAQWRFNASTGNATATGNWINGGSTIKIKENVEDIQNPRETMRKIRACTWR